MASPWVSVPRVFRVSRGDGIGMPSLRHKIRRSGIPMPDFPPNPKEPFFAALRLCVKLVALFPINPYAPIRFAPVRVRDELRFPDRLVLHAADVRRLRGQIDRSSADADPLNGVLHIAHRH